MINPVAQGSSSCSLLKEIPSTTLLVSLTHSVHASAKMEIFDIPQKEKVRKLYTFEEVLGSIFALLLIAMSDQIYSNKIWRYNL